MNALGVLTLVDEWMAIGITEAKSNVFAGHSLKIASHLAGYLAYQHPVCIAYHIADEIAGLIDLGLDSCTAREDALPEGSDHALSEGSNPEFD